MLSFDSNAVLNHYFFNLTVQLRNISRIYYDRASVYLFHQVYPLYIRIHSFFCFIVCLKFTAKRLFHSMVNLT